jgi:hypothetical protein
MDELMGMDESVGMDELMGMDESFDSDEDDIQTNLDFLEQSRAIKQEEIPIDTNSLLLFIQKILVLLYLQNILQI